jgi:hypothetical protein
MSEALLPWFEAAFLVGQKARAVRKDVPSSLLIAVVFGMGRAMDSWVLGQELGERETRKLVRALVDMTVIRRRPTSTAGLTRGATSQWTPPSQRTLARAHVRVAPGRTWSP